MRIVGLALAASVIASAAFAQSSTTTITKSEGPLGDRTTVTKERSDDDTVTTRRTESTGSLGGCDTKSVSKTNEFGDTKTRTKTDC